MSNDQAYQRVLRQLLDAGLDYHEADAKAREQADAVFWKEVDKVRAKEKVSA